MSILGILDASGSSRGSLVYTASTDVALTTRSAPIARATIIDTASVVCPGSVPPMMTILPGADAAAVSSADSGTLSGMHPSASPRSWALSLVAPIPMMSSWRSSPPSSLPVDA